VSNTYEITGEGHAKLNNYFKYCITILFTVFKVYLNGIIYFVDPFYLVEYLFAIMNCIVIGSLCSFSPKANNLHLGWPIGSAAVCTSPQTGGHSRRHPQNSCAGVMSSSEKTGFKMDYCLLVTSTTVYHRQDGSS
jgi:hypothetical protein